MCCPILSSWRGLPSRGARLTVSTPTDMTALSAWPVCCWRSFCLTPGRSSAMGRCATSAPAHMPRRKRRVCLRWRRRSYALSSKSACTATPSRRRGGSTAWHCEPAHGITAATLSAPPVRSSVSRAQDWDGRYWSGLRACLSACSSSKRLSTSSVRRSPKRLTSPATRRQRSGCGA